MTKIRDSSVPGGSPGTSIVTDPPGPATAAPVVGPRPVKPAAALQVPWSKRTGAPRGPSART